VYSSLSISIALLPACSGHSKHTAAACQTYSLCLTNFSSILIHAVACCADAASSELSGEAAASDDSSAEEPEVFSDDEEAEDAEQSGAGH
jgi:hypothetical protein